MRNLDYRLAAAPQAWGEEEAGDGVLLTTEDVVTTPVPSIGEEETPPLAAVAEPPTAAQILADRPDVFAAFFTSYYGSGNDRHSTAWEERVGGHTPEDFALWWYKAYGQYEGYGQGASAPVEVTPAMAALGGEPTGRTTADGISLAAILHDRPDVYRAFFTAFYGPNNDHHSSAWMNRVGGETPEDFANYWYETYGRYEGYVPRSSLPVEPLGPPPEPEPEQPAPEPPAPEEPAAEEPASPEDPPFAGGGVISMDDPDEELPPPPWRATSVIVRPAFDEPNPDDGEYYGPTEDALPAEVVIDASAGHALADGWAA